MHGLALEPATWDGDRAHWHIHLGPFATGASIGSGVPAEATGGRATGNLGGNHPSSTHKYDQISGFNVNSLIT
jgi:hypothetical protein